MPTAFIVCGPMSSGNRLLAGAMVRSGCLGEASTRQPKRPEQIAEAKPGKPFVLIAHYRLRRWIKILRSKGYERVVAVCIVREQVATIRSQQKAGHAQLAEVATANRVAMVAEALGDATAYCDAAHLTTFEGLTEAALAHFLPVLGLEYKAGSLELEGQVTGSVIDPELSQATNRKHY